MAVSRSASPKMILGDLPPSSRETFFKLPEAACTISFPTSVDPVKATLSTSQWAAQAISPCDRRFSKGGAIKYTMRLFAVKVGSLELLEEEVHKLFCSLNQRPRESFLSLGTSKSAVAPDLFPRRVGFANTLFLA